MAEISKEPRIQALESELSALLHDFRAVEKAFVDHTKSKFTETFLRRELSNISEDSSYIVRNVIGQSNINVINSHHFDYSIKIQVPFESDLNYVKWMGVSQILAIKGTGSLTVRVLQVPTDTDINCFQNDVKLQILHERELRSGDSISSQGPHEILDIVKVNNAVLVESLTIKNDNTDIFWTFNEEKKSFMAESSKVTMSRLVNILNVATQTVSATPPSLYETIFAFGDSNLKLKAIQHLLLEGNCSAFDHIQEAIDSPNDTLSEGAQMILDRLVNTK